MTRTAWDLAKLFSGDDDPAIEERRKEVGERTRAFISKWKGRRDYTRDTAVLKEALDDYEAWASRWGTDGDEGYYFWLRTEQDKNDPALKAKLNKVEEYSRNHQNGIQFFALRLGRIPRSRQKALLADPRLKRYRHFLERIFAKSRFFLAESEERVVNLKAATSHANWVRMTSGFLAREEAEVPLEEGGRGRRSFSEILSLVNSTQKPVRDGAALAFNAILKRHADVAEAEINSILANKKVDDELRRVPRPDLPRHVSDDIDSEIVDCLITSVADRFDVARQFYALKAQLLGVKRLRYHERNVEYGSMAGHYSFGEALRLVGRVLKGLDRDFYTIFRDFVENGHFDVYPRKGKASGAFCAHNLKSQPTYILLNHTGRLQDVLTMAHELGHAINNELIRRRQHGLDFGTPLSTAEVASTFLEDFVLQEILRKADDETRLSIVMRKLNDDVTTIFRQVACYRFEQELHREFRQKGYLSKEEIGRLFSTHMAAYMGDAVEQSRGSENWWVYWGHIRSFFYVYSYASGLLISKALQNSVKHDHRFIRKVKEFLSAGLSDSPRNIFMRLGVDIGEPGFWKSGLDEVQELLDNARSLAEKLGKVKKQRPALKKSV